MNANSIEEPFSFDKQEEYKPVTEEIVVDGNKLKYIFPPHSFTQLKVRVN